MSEKRARLPSSSSSDSTPSTSKGLESSHGKRKKTGKGPSNREVNRVPPSVPTGSSRRKSGMPPKRRTDRALMEIRKCQRETRLLLAKLPFARVLREIAEPIVPGLRWQVLAIEALQEAAEMYLVHLFEDSLLCTLHRSKVTLKIEDMRLARRIRSRFENF